MHIAVIGPGAIGSTFAFHLAQGGHDVTVVGRGARLQQLQQDGAVIRTSGERAKVGVRAALDPAAPYDLILVTVLATQVGSVMPAIRESAARRVMFMFNTFEPIEPLRDAVGAERFSFGFPAGVFCLLVDGRIQDQVRSGTTVSDPEWARIFTAAKIPTVVDDDMHSWLRSHAAMVVPLMSIGVETVRRGRGVTWAEARKYRDALRAGFLLVITLGNSIRPPVLRTLAGLPKGFVTALLWAGSRTKMLHDLGRLGATEPRMLIDMMTAAAPGQTPELEAIRPEPL
jgi:2-dehydropantoate 2-reductase